MKRNKTCQSCGMPLNKDPKGGGLEVDGSINPLYCSTCYDQGKFTQPDFSVDDMKAFCKVKMKEMGVPGFLAGLFTLGIPRLERWKDC